MSECTGEPIQFELSSADVSTAAALTIRRAGSNTAYTLLAGERVVLQTVNFNVAAGVTVTVFDDADADAAVDAGERLIVVGAGVSNIVFEGVDGGSAGGLGRVPKAKASGAGQVDITGIGAIVKG